METSDIIKAYLWIRANNSSIPDEVLDLMKYAAMEKLKEVKHRAEDNNGWIKIESEKDLPKEDILCWLIDEEFGMDTGRYDKKENKWYCEKDVEQYVTHYQPLQKPKPPIY